MPPGAVPEEHHAFEVRVALLVGELAEHLVVDLEVGDGRVQGVAAVAPPPPVALGRRARLPPKLGRQRERERESESEIKKPRSFDPTSHFLKKGGRDR